MIIHNCEQRSPEWFLIRSGKMTGSVASKLVTPTGRASTQYRGEISRIIAEHKGWQEPEKIKPTYWMERGINMEAEARRWFEVEVGPVKECGFAEDNSGMFGFSPDGLAYNETDGTFPLELKCPKPSTHIQHVIGEELPSIYKAQCHFALAVSDAPYMWFMSYSPEIEPLLIQVVRGNYTATMLDQMEKYADEFQTAYKRITGIDYGNL